MTKTILFCFFMSILILSACKPLQVNDYYNALSDNKYDSEFPSNSVSDELKYISKTVKKLDVLVFYSNYYFPVESNLDKDMINDSILKLFSDNKTITHESVSGTVSVIYAADDIVGLLTCAHVVDFKDTVYSYFNIDKKQIKSISIKIKQQNHVGSFEHGEPIEIVAMDKKKDIALLVKKAIPFDQVTDVIHYPVGNVKDLQWGSLVYIMGYPLGNLMVTRGVVSVTNKMKTGVFVSDALYNHGISGSPVFAIRDGVPNFEMVGMASSAAAQQSNILVADQPYNNSYKLKKPYIGDIFVDNSKLISYGITYSVTINEILIFIDSNNELIKQNGFDVENFFK